MCFLFVVVVGGDDVSSVFVVDGVVLRVDAKLVLLKCAL